MKKMKEKLGEAPSSKEEDEGEVVQLTGEALARWSFNGGGEGELLPGLVRERESWRE